MKTTFSHTTLWAAGGLLLSFSAANAFAQDWKAPAPADSPFADKRASSYSNFTNEDGTPGRMLWGKAPLNDFGSREVPLAKIGFTSPRQVPAAGVHPRICFTPGDVPEIRARLKSTRCGQEAWKNILSWTEMMKGRYDDKADYAQPDRWKGQFGGLHGRVPLYRLNVPREKGFAYNKHPKAAKIYNSLINGTATDFPPFYWQVFSLEAFRCLMENDEAGAKDLGKAVVTAMKIDQAKRDAEREKAVKKPFDPIAQPVGGFQLAYVYDFIYNWLTPEQKAALHDELAAGTWSQDNYGTFNTAESSRSNWATFSYWLNEVLAIEGEPGFNDLKVRGMYRGWRNLLTYGWFASGATFEGEAKSQIGMDGVLMFAMRQQAYGFENLAGHPYLRAYATNFLPHSVNPMQTGVHKYDLLGGSRSGFASPDTLGFKVMFPDDKVVDWFYRKAIGENYENVPDRPDGYFNALLFYAVYARDFEPANNDITKFNLGNTFFDGERSLLMTRSSWDKDALMLNLHTRGATGGHPFADRNAIMVAGAGRIWAPNGYANFRTFENSVVSIDGKSQNEWVPARMVEFADAPLATFAVGDAKYAWDWNWKRLDRNRLFYTIEDVNKGTVEIPAGWQPEPNTVNDFALTKLPFAYLDRPIFEYKHWVKPKGALSPYVRQPLYPVQRAFRTAGIVRGQKPYALVVDDIQKDEVAHHYDWTLLLENDIQIASIEKRGEREMDILLTGADPNQTQPRGKEALPSNVPAGGAIPTGQPMLLVRVLNRNSQSDILPQIVELPNSADPKKYAPIRRLIIPADAVSPDFKVLLFPYRNGEALPQTVWNAKRDAVSVSLGAQTDSIAFAPSKSGKTNLRVARNTGGKTTLLLETQREISPLR